LAGKPLELRDSPQVDAQFSVAYNVANAIVRRGCELEHFTMSFITDPVVLNLAQKVHAVVDNSVADFGLPQGCIMDMRTSRGSFSKKVGFPRGYPENPLPREELIAKFRKCAAYGSRSLPQGNVEKVINTVSQLEEIKDVSSLVELLVY